MREESRQLRLYNTLSEKNLSPYGDRNTSIKIGDFTVSLIGLNKELMECIYAMYPDFITGDNADVTITLCQSKGFEGLFLPVPSQNEKMGYLGLEIEGYFLIISQFFAGGVKNREGRVLLKLPSSRLYPSTIQNILQVSGSWLAALSGGFIAHSLGLVKERQGYLLYGSSGSGKSTASEMARELLLMSDEMNMVLRGDAKPRICPVPYLARERMEERERQNETKEYPLSGLYSLVQSRHNERHGLKMGETLARLLPCIPYVHDYPSLRKRVFKELPLLLTDIPSYDLEFDLTGGFKEIL